jgi:hypothetical protein
MKGLTLNAAQAQEIYRYKILLLQPNNIGSCLQSAQSKMRGQSVPVAERYGVSPKTVRDIWNRQTWVDATEKLWDEDSSLSSTHSVPSLPVRI